MAVSKRLRYEILRRDNHTCRYCGATAPDAPLRIDHVTPVALGGTDTPDNLVTACQDCNSGKSSATADSTLVADVSQDALRWADAMKQAAEELRSQTEPKRAYRAAFQAVWNEWTWEHNGRPRAFDLPDGWKSSLDNFRETGLPAEAWPDIVEKAMTNRTVRPDNLFRYCCGIAWRMVRELQDRAKAITGAPSGEADAADALAQAALDVWTHWQEDEATPEMRSQFLASVASVRETEDAQRVLHGADWAAMCGEADVAAALAASDHEEVFHQWWSSWLSRVGDYPPASVVDRMRTQVGTLLAAKVSIGRIKRAAIYAGSRRSGLLHFGLDADEQQLVGVTEYISVAGEMWRDAFYASADRWPTEAERSGFINSVARVACDGDIYIADLYRAAAVAGAYQDPDLSTCLTRHLSAFEMASKPLAPAT